MCYRILKNKREHQTETNLCSLYSLILAKQLTNVNRFLENLFAKNFYKLLILHTMCDIIYALQNNRNLLWL